METSELFLKGDQPQCSSRGRSNDSPLRPPGWIRIEALPSDTQPGEKRHSKSSLLSKIILFISIFLFSYHFPYFTPGVQYLPPVLQALTPEFQNRERMIKEILSVVERYPTGFGRATKAQLANVIYEESLRYGQDPKFILALIMIESSFQNQSVSEQGAKGLMQIMPYVAESLAKELGIEWGGDRTLFDPFLNIKIGIHYLSQLVQDFKDLRIALTAYNYGPTYVKGLLERKEKIPHSFYQKLLTVYQTI